jgi:hypothetical protein
MAKQSLPQPQPSSDPEPANPLALAIRNIGATIAGVILAFAIINGIEYLGHQYYTPTVSQNPSEQEIASYIRNSPVSALLFPIVGYFLGVLGGANIAFRLGRTARPINSICVGLIYALGAFSLFRAVSHPLWFVVSSFAAIALGAWLGYLLAHRSKLGEITV